MSEDRDWELFKQKLKAKTEIDLDLYKEPQMKRRINNLITRAGYKECSEYFDHVCGNKDDFAAFIEYLTINVSEFFRTPEKFGKLETDVIPDLLKRSSKLNIWSAGCSIGAEPYSLAIIMKEMTPGTRHRILASDLDIEIWRRRSAAFIRRMKSSVCHQSAAVNTLMRTVTTMPSSRRSKV